MNKKDSENTKKAIEACIANAEASLSMAERELGKGADHLCFHLALLALEEIGKSILILISHTVSVSGKEKPSLDKALDDHVKKIFWALWQGLLFRDKPDTKEIDDMRGLATRLHENRLLYLYTDPSNPVANPSDKLEPGEAEKLIKLTRARLELEKKQTVNYDFTSEQIEEVTWFFTVVEDKEIAKQIFSKFSLDKLKELGNGRDWIKWLYEEDKKVKEEMIKLAQREMARKRPETEDEKLEPKYRMKVRVQSHSHDIRDNAFDEWNKGVVGMKIYKTARKKLPDYIKSELLLDLIFYKTVSPGALWEAGLSLAQSLVIAINIGTMGLFWWNMPKDVVTYYDEIDDLEADKNGGIKIRIVPGDIPAKGLVIDWGEPDKRTVKKEDVSEISLVSAFLLFQNEQLKDFLHAYGFFNAFFQPYFFKLIFLLFNTISLFKHLINSRFSSMVPSININLA